MTHLSAAKVLLTLDTGSKDSATERITISSRWEGRLCVLPLRVFLELEGSALRTFLTALEKKAGLSLLAVQRHNHIIKSRSEDRDFEYGGPTARCVIFTSNAYVTRAATIQFNPHLR